MGNFQTGTGLWLLALGFKSAIHQGLINHKQLSDPFYDINKQKIQWVKNGVGEYRTVFTVTSKQLKRDDAQLIIKALTRMPSYLNETLLLKADNMFVSYTFKALKSLLNCITKSYKNNK